MTSSEICSYLEKRYSDLECVKVDCPIISSETGFSEDDVKSRLEASECVSYFAEESKEGAIVGRIYDVMESIELTKFICGVGLFLEPREYDKHVLEMLDFESRVVNEARKCLDGVELIHLDAFHAIEAMLVTNPPKNGTQDFVMFTRFVVIGRRKEDEK